MLSPRHADGLVVTGPVRENVRTALLETYAAIASPKLVIVVGTEAISGGVFRGHPEVHDGCGSFLPVDPVHSGVATAPHDDSRWVAATPWSLGRGETPGSPIGIRPKRCACIVRMKCRAVCPFIWSLGFIAFGAKTSDHPMPSFSNVLRAALESL